MTLKVIKPWYEKGLQFKCTQCGKCCTGKDSYVFLSENDVQKLHKYFNLPRQEFIEKYTQITHGKIVLKTLNKKGDCIFLKDNKCEVYKNRPVQCKTFPWWPSVIDSKSTWEESKKLCEGIDHPEGEPLSLEEIQMNLTRKIKLS